MLWITWVEIATKLLVRTPEMFRKTMSFENVFDKVFLQKPTQSLKNLTLTFFIITRYAKIYFNQRHNGKDDLNHDDILYSSLLTNSPDQSNLFGIPSTDDTQTRSMWEMWVHCYDLQNLPILIAISLLIFFL